MKDQTQETRQMAEQQQGLFQPEQGKQAAADQAAEMQDVIGSMTSMTTAAQSEEASDRLQKVPLTDSQMGILLSCGMGEACTKYYISARLSFARPEGMTADGIKAAVNRVLEAHPALYAGICQEDESFYMLRRSFPQEGLCDVQVCDEETAVRIYAKGVKPIALGEDPLCRVRILLTEARIHLLFDWHHVVGDGTSLQLVMRSMMAAFSGEPVPQETLDAFEVYRGEEARKQPDAMKAAREWFANLLEGDLPDSSLLPDHPACEDAKIPEAILFTDVELPNLQAYLDRTGIKRSSFFMGVFAYALAKMTGQTESLFTFADTGRVLPNCYQTVMMMVKTLPVRVKLNEEETGAALIKALQQQCSVTRKQLMLPFSELAHNYGISEDVSFVYQGSILKDIDGPLGSLHLDMADTREAFAKLCFHVLKTDEGCRLRLEYRADLYDESTIRRFASFYARAALAFMQDVPLKQMTLLDDTERRFLDAENRKVTYPLPVGTVVDVFERNAERYGNRIMVSCRENRYTWTRVKEITDRLAGYVSDLGIGREQTVAVLIPRSEYMVLASLGVMKAGAIYQPLDPAYPVERLNFMVKDADARLVIADPALRPLLTEYTGPVLLTSEIAAWPEMAKTDKRPEPANIAPHPEDTFILLYTSGTTGTPKGVRLSHSNLMSLVEAHCHTLQLDDTCVCANYASYGFDAHIGDIYPAICSGAKITIVPDEIRLDLPAVKDFCEAEGVTHIMMTTQVARQFATQFSNVKGLRVLFCGGEKLVSLQPPEGYRMFNLYGPSECTVWVSFFQLKALMQNIPIGHSSLGNYLYVADAFGRRVPLGVPGELIICGPQVGKGYLNRPEKTAEVFVPNTYEEGLEGAYTRCYRTGDVVRFLPDGNLEFIGRRDQQVKIRGFRVELGEVERAIREDPSIKDATISVLEGDNGKSLCAYVVSDEKVNPAKLAEHIRQGHPAYMVPAAIMQLDSIPLTVNGKVDKRKLPKPELRQGADDVKKPQNPLQQQIYDILAKVLENGAFGVDTDVFDAGLSSISSMRFCAELAESFGITVQMRHLKKYATVEGLEGFVREKLSANEATQKPAAARTTVRKQLIYGKGYPLTKTMEGIYVECAQKPESTFYNVPYLLKLSAGLDEERLKAALVQAVEAHPCMKAELYTDENGAICQHRALDDAFTVADIPVLFAQSLEELQLVKPFKLNGGRLFEIALIHADGLYLYLDFHHIIADGTSFTLFMQDVEKAYAGEALQSETYTGFDVAKEEQQARAGEDLQEAKDYYAKLLEDVDKDFLPLPDRLADAPKANGKLRMTGDESNIPALRELCRQRKMGLNACYTAAFGLTLARYAGMEYSVFNTIYNGRNDSRAWHTFAMMVKTLPVVCRLQCDTMGDLAENIGRQLLCSMSNDLYSYAEISRELEVRNDVMFIYQGENAPREAFCGVKAEEIQLPLSGEKTELSLQVWVQKGVPVYELAYNPEKYTEAMMHAFLSAFDQAVTALAQQQKLTEVCLLSRSAEAEMERHNQTQRPYDRSATINSMMMAQVQKQPEHLCVSFKEKQLSYAQVAELSGRVALWLHRHGVKQNNVVAILIHRDENMVITAHGAIRSGAAYLGLDPTYPQERLAFMVQDSGAACMIAERELSHLVGEVSIPILYTDEIAQLPALTKEDEALLAEIAARDITPENDALVVYSSGTTGQPKGSVLQHKNIVCFTDNYAHDVQLDTHARIATYASFGFDGGAMDVFGAPMTGAALYVVPDEIRMDPALLEQFYVKNGITYGFMTTQVGTMFIANTHCTTLRYFFVGGEKFIPVTGPEGVCLMNGYGPSETMCYVNRFVVRSREGLQPIGKVSANMKEYVVDACGHRQPYGACGELCISGGQTGRGYLNRPEKTAAVFVPNPFSREEGYERMYRTGDVARMLPDGNYDFVGRRDGQVKIRGFRVELPEVEQQIRLYPGVKKTVVTAFDHPAGGKALCAYVVTEGKLDTEALKAFIAREKPAYMVPAVMIQLDEIPLTSNGKVDTRKLPKPQLTVVRKGAEPADETEETICRIFGEVLGQKHVYADDDFFAIGGTSISAIHVIAKCGQAGLSLVYKDLFANPTAQKLKLLLQGAKQQEIMAGDLEKGDAHNYAALRGNVDENLPQISTGSLGDVLLTGATGFLGSHMLHELLNAAPGRVICLVRGKEGMSAETRFEMMMVYYFEEWYGPEQSARVTVVDGSLEDDDLTEKLKDMHFDTIINCAANVKHFAAGDELVSANYSGVENLIELAEARQARLIQISSISVSGEVKQVTLPQGFLFKETDLNIGQSLENKYVYTKYLAEQAVIDEVSRGKLRGKVIRLGNLMARAEDSEFQLNAGTNGFLRMFRGFSKLGCFPLGLIDAKVEFSPIDAVARAVRLLAGTPDTFTLFHCQNCNTIHQSYLLQALCRAGRTILPVEDAVFEQRLQEALKHDENVSELGGLLAYRNRAEDGAEDGQAEVRLKVEPDVGFTARALYRLGFSWPLISEQYLQKMVDLLMDMEFFD